MKVIQFHIFIILLLAAPKLFAQEIPPVYSQFYMNPFVYNPSYAGSDGYASLYLVHRRQWMGIEGAPVTSTVNVHSPFTKTTAGGLLISHDQAGILNTTHAAGSFVYIIPFGTEHHFRMGLSAGVSRQSLDLSQATPEQLVYLANREEATNLFQAKFGISYRYKELNIGISSNNLTRVASLNGIPTKEGTFAPMQDLVLNAIYYFPLAHKIQAEPYFIYHQLSSYNRKEGGLLFYYNEMIWAGASYRTDYGITTLFGLSLKKAVKFAYAFELGNKAISGLPTSTHELQLAIKLGKEKKNSKEIIRKPRFEM